MDRRFPFCQRLRYCSIIVFPVAAMINRRRGSPPEATSSVDFSLSQNYPNPFNPTTTIEFTIPEDGHATLMVYDLIRREVATLMNGELAAGVYHQVVFDALRLSRGMYVARLQSAGNHLIRKMVLVR